MIAADSRKMEANITAKLFVDVSILMRRDAGTGIQRVVRTLWNYLRQNGSPLGQVIPVAASDGHGFSILPSDFLDYRGNVPLQPGSPPRMKRGDIFLGLDLSPRLIWRYRKKLRNWRAQGVRLSFLVYDLLPLTHGKFFGWRTRLHFRRWFRFVSKNADQLICISQAVADAVAALTDQPSIEVLALGNDGVKLPSGDGAQTDGIAPELHEWLRARKTILAVGTVEPRKCYDALLDAIRWLQSHHPDEAPNLLCVGKPGWKTRRLQARMRALNETETWFQWVDNATDAALAQFYEGSAGLVAPSHAEGFGLPVAEALNAGLTVLARDQAAFRELAHPLLYFFGQDTPAALGNAIRKWLAAPHRALPAQRTCVTWHQSGESLSKIITSLQTADL